MGAARAHSACPPPAPHNSPSSLKPLPGRSRTRPLLSFALEALLLEEPFADIEMQFHGFQPVLPVRLKGQDAALRFSGEPHAGELARAGPQGAGDGAVAVRGYKAAHSDTSLFRQLVCNHAVEPCQRVAHHFSVERLARLIARTGTQPFGGDIPRDVSEPMPDQVFRNDKVLPVGPAPAQDDVGVGMSGIVMVGRDPGETRAQLDLGARHHFPRIRRQVSDFISALG